MRCLFLALLIGGATTLLAAEPTVSYADGGSTSSAQHRTKPAPSADHWTTVKVADCTWD
jgi:hypothetical protein